MCGRVMTCCLQSLVICLDGGRCAEGLGFHLEEELITFFISGGGFRLISSLIVIVRLGSVLEATLLLSALMCVGGNR